MIKILIIEDLPSDYMLLSRTIKKNITGCELKNVDNMEDFITGLNSFKPDIILSDLSIPGFNWHSAYKFTLENNISVPFIIVSGSTNPDIAEECLRSGAKDFISKDNPELICPAIVRVIKLP